MGVEGQTTLTDSAFNGEKSLLVVVVDFFFLFVYKLLIKSQRLWWRLTFAVAVFLVWQLLLSLQVTSLLLFCSLYFNNYPDCLSFSSSFCCVCVCVFVVVFFLFFVVLFFSRPFCFI